MILGKQHKTDSQISLNHPIEIWNMAAVGEDETGAEIEAPVKVADDWALVVPDRGMESSDTNRTLAETRYKVTIRYRDDIDPSMTIVWEDKAMQITGIVDLQGRHMYQEIQAVDDYKGVR